MPEGTASPATGLKPDTEAYRLRAFVEGLKGTDELEIVADKVELADLAAHMDGNAKAVLFEAAGPEGAEMIGNLVGSRSRIAAGFGVPEENLLTELQRRLAAPQEVVEIAAADAPVQQVVWTGDDADFTRLPVPFQHERDGGPYLSATIDVVRNPETGLTNLGCRRMMLRGRTEAGVDLNAPSDLQAIYRAAAGRGEQLPVSFILGAHPVDHVAANMRIPVDEVGLIAALRGAPLAVVKCVTNDLCVPADAEMVLEGYLDEHGYSDDEGPYGEFLGYYGVMKRNPVFHLTAITMRHDALFQTSTISGRHIGRTDTAVLNTLKTESVVWRALQTAIRQPVAVYATPTSGGGFHVRAAIRQLVPGEARNAIAAIFGCLANVKHAFVVDDDIDIFDDGQIEWAMATRFQADRDLVVEGGFRSLPLDPSLDGSRVGAKAGFDMTVPFGKRASGEWQVSDPPSLEGAQRFDSVRAALEDGPRTFGELMACLGTRDGREIVLALDELRQAGLLSRGEGGTYLI
ncbi:MAG: UbiD family decarboxylase [Alphaproteobacteria bacterium]